MYAKNINATLMQKFSHGSRFKTSAEIFSKHVDQKSLVLDFGTGDGRVFLDYLSRGKNCKYYGYDISQEMIDEADPVVKDRVFLTSNIKDIEDVRFDYISCLETLEHIPDEAVNDVIAKMASLLAKGGILVISVPIESGPPSLFKQIIRSISGQRERIATFKAILLSFFYFSSSIRRDQNDPGHTGFDFFEIKRKIKKNNLSIIKTMYSPFNSFAGFIFNSQVFYIVRANN